MQDHNRKNIVSSSFQPPAGMAPREGAVLSQICDEPALFFQGGVKFDCFDIFKTVILAKASLRSNAPITHL